MAGGTRGTRYPASVLRLARQLYQGGLSCKGVERALRERGLDPAPCWQWVRYHMHREGLLRDRVLGLRVALEQREGKPYRQAEARARQLDARGWPRKSIAARVGVDERTVRHWLGRSRVSHSEACRRGCVLRAARAAPGWREQSLRVLELRARGATYDQIVADTGLSYYRVRQECTAAGLGGRSAARRSGAAAPGVKR